MRRALLAIVIAATLGAAQRPISIVINGDTLALEPPPRFIHGVLFVPVRRTIEALGLTFAREGPQITVQVGSKAVSLTMGSKLAEVDGNRVALESPPLEIKDVLYVPVRFFTDALGAQASFDRRANALSIVAQLVGRSANGLVTVRGGYERFGTVAAVDVLSDPPTVTLSDNGSVKVIKVASNAAIDVTDVTVNVTSPGELADIRPGDFARIEMRKDGRVERIVDEYGSRSGRIVAIASSEFVLADGQVIAPDRTTEIALNGKAASLYQLRPGDAVTIRYNVETNEVREILASRAVATTTGAPAQPLAVASVESDATHPLRPGETIHVVARGTPGGSAIFDIGSDVANQAMHEQSAGLYSGSYTIPRGANFSDAPLIVRLQAAGGEVEAAAAQGISASSVPPGISDVAPRAGTTVNTNRPAVYATFVSDAVPVRSSSALLWINGRDVTSECVRSATFIQYLPSYSYPDGPVHVTVRVADEAGNTTTKSWDFTIRSH
ncbi:MAG: copper amine oxidase N-terminal domain-containing protein [Candidatus Eremiobacteraeota bacterium]|nr:copper amine oxidase N-terminal domain-containing protein [Candidatus Eremiobacteraeota bacterium]